MENISALVLWCFLALGAFYTFNGSGGLTADILQKDFEQVVAPDFSYGFADWYLVVVAQKDFSSFAPFSATVRFMYDSAAVDLDLNSLETPESISASFDQSESSTQILLVGKDWLQKNQELLRFAFSGDPEDIVLADFFFFVDNERQQVKIGNM